MSECPSLQAHSSSFANCSDFPHPIQLPAQASIVTRGQKCNYLFSLRDGMARVTRPDDRNIERTIGFLFPGDLAGVTWDFVNKCRYTVETVAPSTVCRWPRHCLEALFSEIPAMRSAFLGGISHEMNMLQQRLQILDLKTAGARLAHFLATMAQRCANPGGEKTTPVDSSFPFHDAEIADYLNLSPGSLQEAMKALQLSGAIRRSGPSRISIEDESVLQGFLRGGG